MERVSDIIRIDVNEVRNIDMHSSETQITNSKVHQVQANKQKNPIHSKTISSLIALSDSDDADKKAPLSLGNKKGFKKNTAENECQTQESTIEQNESSIFELPNDESAEISPTQISLEEIFKSALVELKKTTSEKIFNTWFNNIKLISVEPSVSENSCIMVVCLGCQNKFSQEHLKHQYSEQIKKSFEIATQSPVTIKYEIIKELPKASQSFSEQTQSVLKDISQKKVKVEIAQSKSDESNLNFNYNFSNFVIGTCNQFAHAACLKVSENPGSAYNPLLIYGGVGLGKTHLANAIGNAARRRNKKVLLASSEKFVSELISSLKSNSMDKFKARFRSLDVLIIDDIQFIIGKERTQEEFFHTFNELYGKNKQIIITSDKLPQDLIGLEERLRTRFSSGLSVDLQAPDFETRIAILIKKAESYNLNLSYGVAKIIAERIDTNVRELEGALTRLQALCSLFSQEPSEELAKKVVDTISPIKLKEITTDNIKEIVAKQFNVSIHDLSGKRRTQNIAMARQVAMYLCRKHTARSFPEIGAIFGGRDHSTVIHAIKTVSDRLLSDTILNESIDNIISLLEKR